MLPNLGSFASLTEQISRDLALLHSPSRALSARA
jgi:hypothetical protein